MAPKLTPAQDLLLRLMPLEGGTIGNTRLEPIFEAAAREKGIDVVPHDTYWHTREALRAAGLVDNGRGRGGSLYRIGDVNRQTPGQLKELYTRELSLYMPFAHVVQTQWLPQRGVQPACSVVKTTALAGKRNTGGQWTRPDVTAVYVRDYTYIPGRVLEVVTFEIKPHGGGTVVGVYEALAHTRFSTRAYLAVHTPGEESLPTDVAYECERHDIGLITFVDPADFGTYEELLTPPRRSPDPERTDNFIRTQMVGHRHAIHGLVNAAAAPPTDA